MAVLPDHGRPPWQLRSRAGTRRAPKQSRGFRITPELERARGAHVATFTHFLELPILTLIVSLGAMRPDTWLHFAVGSAAAIAATATLTWALPRIYASEPAVSTETLTAAGHARADARV